jgi:hypothetical protein
MGGGLHPKHVQEQVMEKLIRSIYMNARGKIGPTEMMKYFPMAELALDEFKWLKYKDRSEY